MGINTKKLTNIVDKEPKQIKAIIFDVDGVIIDSVKIKDACFTKILKEIGIMPKDVQYIFEKTIGRKNVLEMIKEDFELSFNVEKMLSEFKKILEKELEHVNEIKFVIKFIKENQDKYLFFVNTAMPQDELEKLFTQKNLHEYFIESFSIDFGTKKSNVATILTKYELEKSEVLFFDDKILNVEDLKKFGVNSVLFEKEKTNIKDEIQKIEEDMCKKISGF